MSWCRKYAVILLGLALTGCIKDDLSDCPTDHLVYVIEALVKGLPAGDYTLAIHNPLDEQTYETTEQTSGEEFTMEVTMPPFDLFDSTNSPTIKLQNEITGEMLYPLGGMDDRLVDLIERSVPRDEIEGTYHFTLEFDFSEGDLVVRINGWDVIQDSYEVTLRMVVPRTHSATRAIGQSEECTISTLDVLVFRVNGTNETFVYSEQGTPAPGNVTGAVHQEFNVTMQVENYQQRLVLITNARAQVGALLSSADWRGTDKETMLAGLKYTIPMTPKGWNSTSPSNFDVMPMWGESVPEMITMSGITTSAEINLMRMVARVDVRLDTSVAGLTDKFKLKSVGLYNSNTSGLIVPSSANVTNNVATAPSLPSPLSTFPPLTYTDFSSPGVTDVAMTGVIYMLEAKSNINFALTPCLVIGGIYGSDITVTYYRINFVDANKNQVDILRNNLYTINITNVAGSGHVSLEDAFNAQVGNTRNFSVSLQLH